MNVRKMALIASLCVQIACLGTYYEGERDVTVTREDFNGWYESLERRWPTFFNRNCLPVPPLPGSDQIFNKVSWKEVPHSDDFPTCTFSPSDYVIRIGDDKWGNCEAHEIGHAACQILGDPRGCEAYEHSDIKSRCTP